MPVNVVRWGGGGGGGEGAQRLSFLCSVQCNVTKGLMVTSGSST